MGRERIGAGAKSVFVTTLAIGTVLVWFALSRVAPWLRAAAWLGVFALAVAAAEWYERRRRRSYEGGGVRARRAREFDAIEGRLPGNLLLSVVMGGLGCVGAVIWLVHLGRYVLAGALLATAAGALLLARVDRSSPRVRFRRRVRGDRDAMPWSDDTRRD